MGSALGNWLAGRQVNKKMFVFQSMIWYSFCGGGVVGAFGYLHFKYLTLILPIVIVLSSTARIKSIIASHKITKILSIK